MSEIVKRIKEVLIDSGFLDNAMPSLSQWGINDRDVLVHSMGVSVWNTLGHDLGFMAVAECPAPTAVGDDIRSDSTWFLKSDQQPIVFIEFERYDGSSGDKQKLSDKLTNLMEASERWGQPSPLLILIAWNIGNVHPPDVKGLMKQVRLGVKNKKGVKISGTHPKNFVFCRFMFKRLSDGKIKLNDIIFQEGA